MNTSTLTQTLRINHPKESTLISQWKEQKDLESFTTEGKSPNFIWFISNHFNIECEEGSAQTPNLSLHYAQPNDDIYNSSDTEEEYTPDICSTFLSVNTSLTFKKPTNKDIRTKINLNDDDTQ